MGVVTIELLLTPPFRKHDEILRESPEVLLIYYLAYDHLSTSITIHINTLHIKVKKVFYDPEVTYTFVKQPHFFETNF